ncbi:MAG: hypothetical protein OEW72_00380 [Gammaproteobacteria bacterium]|nr:hypothetical protein [Gammaproteobacteria bacterium]
MAEAARPLPGDPSSGTAPNASPAPAQGGRPPALPSVHEFGLWSGFEGREELLGRGLVQLLKTVIADAPYQHHLNDAALKAHLNAIQFAKNHGMLPQLVAHDVKTLAPVNRRVGQLVAKTGNPEYGLVGLFERTDCWYQLVLEWRVEPGRRTWRSPFHTVLEMGRRIGQFDLTEQEIHEQWTAPRIQGYAADIGIKVNVSPWHESGWLSCELA